MANFDTLNTSLQNDAGYQAALRGEWVGPNGQQMFPVGSDGKVLPGFRTTAARYYAELAQGGGTYDPAKVNALYQGGSAQVDPNTGQWSDPNADHWYSDPRVLGPLAVGTGIGLGALGYLGGGGSAVAGGTSATAPTLGGGSTLAANLPASSALVGAPASLTAPLTVGGASVPTGAFAQTASSYGGATGATGGAAAGGGSLFSRILGSKWTPVIGNLLGTGIQSYQANKAAQAQIDAANRMIDLSRDIYTQQRADLTPYREVGNGAIYSLADMTGVRPQSTPTVPGLQTPTSLATLGR